MQARSRCLVRQRKSTSSHSTPRTPPLHPRWPCMHLQLHP
jgi:hypothetical protein